MTTSTGELNETQKMMMAQSAYDDAAKSKGLAYVLWLFLGIFGGHRFYAGDKGMGVGMLLTLGGLGIWALIDVFLIGKRIDTVNREKKQRIFAQYGLVAPVAF